MELSYPHEPGIHHDPYPFHGERAFGHVRSQNYLAYPRDSLQSRFLLLKIQRAVEEQHRDAFRCRPVSEVATEALDISSSGKKAEQITFGFIRDGFLDQLTHALDKLRSGAQELSLFLVFD